VTCPRQGSQTFDFSHRIRSFHFLCLVASCSHVLLAFSYFCRASLYLGLELPLCRFLKHFQPQKHRSNKKWYLRMIVSVGFFCPPRCVKVPLASRQQLSCEEAASLWNRVGSHARVAVVPLDPLKLFRGVELGAAVRLVVSWERELGVGRWGSLSVRPRSPRCPASPRGWMVGQEGGSRAAEIPGL